MFSKTGYLHLKNYFDPEQICIEADRAILNSQKIKWRYIKVYHNIYIHKFINIFSINFPFNDKLNSNLFKEFVKIDLRSLILKNTNWKNIKISSVELQHNEKYNYQSTWHRDTEFANLDEIVAIVYLRDENGFRLVPKNLENEMIINSEFSKKKTYSHGYTNLPNRYYHQFDAKAGDIIIFDSGLLHQGNCKGKRTHLFVKCKQNDTEIIFEDNLKPEASLNNIDEQSKQHNWNFNSNPYSLSNKIKSIFNLILYYFPIVKIVKYLLDYKEKKIHFHYSFFQ